MSQEKAREVFRRITVHGVATKKQSDGIMAHSAHWVEGRFKQEGYELPDKIQRSAYGGN